jgi:hypothetical protein
MTRPDASAVAGEATADGFSHSVSSSSSGLAHGAFVWPAWGVALLGALCVLSGLTYLGLRLYRARARRGKL